MTFGSFLRPKPAVRAAGRLYTRIVEQARAKDFYTVFAVPDTIDGRFDLIALHAFLVLEPLRAHGQAGAETGTALANAIFSGFDQALRDLGVSDFGLARRIKAMADAFYGRLEAYRAAGDDPVRLAEALVRNLYRGEETRAKEADFIADYAIAARKSVESQTRLLSGEVAFGSLPERPRDR